MRSWIVLAVAVGCIPKIERGPVRAEQVRAPVPLVALEADDGPVIHLAAMVRAGSALDPVGSEGLAHLTARGLIDAGAGDRASSDVRRDLFSTGNAFDLVVSREWVNLRLRCHTDHADLCVELFADALTAPRFADGDVIRLREDAEQHVTQGLLASEEALGAEVFEATLFEGHPYGHPVEGRSGVLPTLGADAARRFHDAHYVREAMWVGIAGHHDQALRDQLTERLQAVPARRAPEFVPMAPRAVTGRSLIAVEVDAPVTGLHLGHPVAVDRSHPDWPALTLATTILGAHRQSFGRLYRGMRTERGLNYGDYAYAEPFTQRGWGSQPEQGVLRRQPHFSLWIRPTTADNGPFALKFAIDELERFVAEGPDPDELDEVRAWLSAAAVLWAQDSGRRLAFALEAAATGTPNVHETLPEAIATLSADQVTAALQRHVSPDDLVIVAVSGQAASLVTRLVEDDATPIVYGDVEPGDAQATRDAQIADKDLGLERERTWVVPAQGIFR